MATLIDNDLQVTGTLTTDASLETEELSCSGNMSISGATTLTGGLHVSGASTLGAVTVATLYPPAAGTLPVTGAVVIDGQLEATSLSAVSGGATFEGDVGIYSGSTPKIWLRDTGDMEATGSLTINSPLEIQGSAWITSSATIGTLTLAGDLTIEGGGITVTGTVSGISEVSGTISVYDEATPETNSLLVSGWLTCGSGVKFGVLSGSGTRKVYCTSDGTLFAYP